MNLHTLVRLVPALLLAMAMAAIAQQDASSEDENRQAEPTAQTQGGESDPEGPNIYPALAAQLIENDEFDVPVIDVRSAGEVEETGMVAGATNIPHTETDALAEFIGDKDRTVILYCGSGRRAGLAIDALRARGFHGLVNAGGYEHLTAELDDDG
ncbi:MAG: rhodanese-like domain-containing protein [Wenzhouxiangellaceae bacterium]|nr:rhodanese-like domain-containing protein [Wenzhouxiangellaceae bacterium]